MGDTVFIVGADAGEGARIAAALRGGTWAARSFADAEALFDALDDASTGCVLVVADLPAPGARGLIQKISDVHPPLAVVVLDRTRDVGTAVELMRAGAVDVLEQPWTSRRLRAALERTLRRGASNSYAPR